MADKFGLRAWTINLRTWIFGFTYLVFKTTYTDRGKPLRESAFFFTRMMLFPPLDKRHTCDKAKGLRITSERYIGKLGYPIRSHPWDHPRLGSSAVARSSTAEGRGEDV